MGLFSWSLVFFPFVLILAFLISRQYHGWLIIRKRSLTYVWIPAELLVLSVLFLPTYRWIDSTVIPFPKPFDAFYASMIYLMPLLALILATFLLFNGLTLIKQQPTTGDENIASVKPSFQRTGWIAVTILILSGLLYGSTLYNLYFQFIWDSITDSVGILILFGPLTAVFLSGVLLSGSLRGRNIPKPSLPAIRFSVSSGRGK